MDSGGSLSTATNPSGGYRNAQQIILTNRTMYTKDELAKMNAYELVKYAFNLQSTKSIDIPIEADELERLREGESFDWEFDGVQVHVYAQ